MNTTATATLTFTLQEDGEISIQADDATGGTSDMSKTLDMIVSTIVASGLAVLEGKLTKLQGFEELSGVHKDVMPEILATT